MTESKWFDFIDATEQKVQSFLSTPVAKGKRKAPAETPIKGPSFTISSVLSNMRSQGKSSKKA